MGKLFEIENVSKGNPIIKPKPDCWIIRPIRAVIEEYPEQYGKIVYYLHCMNSYRPDDNPYADVPIVEREEQILRDIELDIDPDSDIIKEALECVRLKYETPFSILYIGIKEYLNKSGRKLATLEPDFNAKEGNSAAIRAFIKDYNAMSLNYKQVFKDFDEEAGNSRLKGGGRAAYDEDDEDDLMDD